MWQTLASRSSGQNTQAAKSLGHSRWFQVCKICFDERPQEVGGTRDLTAAFCQLRGALRQLNSSLTTNGQPSVRVRYVRAPVVHPRLDGGRESSEAHHYVCLSLKPLRARWVHTKFPTSSHFVSLARRTFSLFVFRVHLVQARTGRHCFFSKL